MIALCAIHCNQRSCIEEYQSGVNYFRRYGEKVPCISGGRLMIGLLFQMNASKSAAYNSIRQIPTKM